MQVLKVCFHPREVLLADNDFSIPLADLIILFEHKMKYMWCHGGEEDFYFLQTHVHARAHTERPSHLTVANLGDY